MLMCRVCAILNSKAFYDKWDDKWARRVKLTSERLAQNEADCSLVFDPSRHDGVSEFEVFN